MDTFTRLLDETGYKFAKLAEAGGPESNGPRAFRFPIQAVYLVASIPRLSLLVRELLEGPNRGSCNPATECMRRTRCDSLHSISACADEAQRNPHQGPD